MATDDPADGKHEITLDVTTIATDALRVADFLDRETPGNVGVALSGGGSRAACAAMGQLRALHALGVLDQVRAISSVSGGSWLSAAWTFLPEDRSDADFWGTYVEDPSTLTLTHDDDAPPGTCLREVAETCFAYPITQRSFNAAAVAARLLGQPLTGVRKTLSWQVLIGDLLYGPLGLYDAHPDGRSKTFFAYDAAAVQAAREANPELPAVAHTVKRPGPGEARRPFYVCNAGMPVSDAQGNAAIAPVQGTAFFVGIPSRPAARDQHGRPVGGGAVPPHAFGGRLVAAQSQPEVAHPRRITVAHEASFGLMDIVGISSAFHSDFLLDHDQRDAVAPMYCYFRPLADAPDGQACHFVDGGDVENQGVAGLLAYQDIDRIIVFVNTPRALERSKDGLDQVVIDDSIGPLFGYQPYREGVGYLPYPHLQAPSIPGGTKPREDMDLFDFRYDRVFPAEAFPVLLEGLWKATTAGGEAPGVGPCAFLQRDVPVLANEWFGVRPRTIDVMWFYLNAASQWLDRLAGPLGKMAPPKWPHYPTADTGLSATAVNYLAHFTSWVVTQHANDVRSLFAPPREP